MKVVKKEYFLKIGKVALFLMLRPKSIYTILFLLIIHLFGSLGVYFNQGQFLILVNKIGVLLKLNQSIIDIVNIIVNLIFGVDLMVIFIESLVIIGFIVILIYQIKKESRLKEDSERIKTIEETSSETNQDVKSIKKELAEMSKQLKESNGSSKVDISKIESGLTTIIKYCISTSRNGRPNQALEILSQNNNLVDALDKDSPVRLEFKIAEAKALREASKSDEAILKNEEIISKHKDDIRPYLNLADMYLQVSDYENYEKYLAKAEAINPDHPTIKNIKIIKIIKNIEENGKIELDENDIWGNEGSFERAHCYYIHSIVSSINGEAEKRDEFLDNAIKIDGEYIYYEAQKISNKILDLNQKKKEGENIFNLSELSQTKNEIEKLEFAVKDDDAPKRLLEVGLLKLEMSFLQHPNNEYQALKNIVDNLVKLFIQTRFDDFNDRKITEMFDGAQPFITEEIVNKIVKYILGSKKKPSDILVFVVLSTAISCFENIDDVIELSKKFEKHKLGNLLSAFKAQDEKLIIEEINKLNEIEKFKIIICVPDIKLRLKLIDNILGSLDEQKRDLLLKMKAGLLYQEKDFESAIRMIQGLDLSKADAIMSDIAFDVAREIGIYHDVERDSLKRLLELNAYPDRKYYFLGNLAIAQYHLREFPEALINAKESLENGGKLALDGLQFLLFIALDILISEDKIEEAEILADQHRRIERDYKLSMKISEILLAKKEFDEAIKAIVDATLRVENISPEQLLASSHQLTIIQNVSGEEIAKPDTVDENVFVKLDGIEGWFFIGEKNKSLDATFIQEKNDGRYKVLIGKKIGDKITWPGDDGRMNKIERRIEDLRFTADYIGLRGAQEMQKMAQAGNPYIKIFEVGTTPESMKESLMKFMGREEDVFKQFVENKLPFSFYASLVGSAGYAFSKIRSYQEGFVNTILNAEDWEVQKVTAKKAMEGRQVHIDGTSLFMLIETGSFKKIIPYLSKFAVPSSAMDEYRNLIQKFSTIPKKGSLQIGLEKNDVKATMYDEDSANKIKDRIKEFCDYVQSKANSVYGIGAQERSSNVVENKIIPAMSDATIKAQQDADSLVMTEDAVYMELNSQFTKKRKPEYFSLLALATVLYEQGNLCLDDYLEIFYWLTVYRVKFLSTSAEFIISTIIQNQKSILTIHPDLINKLNLDLVWSEEYDANINSVINVCSDVLVALIKNNTIIEDYLRLIFPKLYMPVLKGRNSHYWAEKLLQVVAIKIKRSSSVYNIGVENRFELLQIMMNNYVKNQTGIV